MMSHIDFKSSQAEHSYGLRRVLDSAELRCEQYQGQRLLKLSAVW